jgi:hypothetical protein
VAYCCFDTGLVATGKEYLRGISRIKRGLIICIRLKTKCTSQNLRRSGVFVGDYGEEW